MDMQFQKDLDNLSHEVDMAVVRGFIHRGLMKAMFEVFLDGISSKNTDE